ncbi:MAG: mechanosensitive ion channel [Myxococcales bacterium]|nr:mechanosensitive ion channel [Myxococcales bacterium]MCB9753191.1 mechanosensitive ion channel [Myxococcales bacterium]
MFGTWLESLQSNDALMQALLTVALAFVLLIARAAVGRALRRAQLPAELHRRWLVVARNSLLLLLLFGAIAIWAQELRTLALSFVAIAAAIVVATKELLMCLSGTLLRSSSRNVSLGDRVEIAGVRGDIIDLGVLTTTLLEIGPGARTHQRTGRAIVLPNSVWLSAPAINETFTSRYVLHTVTIPVKLAEHPDWERLEQRLLAAAEAECEEHLEAARDELTRQDERQGLTPTTIEPRVALHSPEPGRLDLVLRFPAPSARRGRVEQAILRRYFASDAA